jgi:allantoin racemase
MHILIINPNSTASMTRRIGEAAKRAARAGTQITAVNPKETPPSIQGREDGEAALPGLYALFEAEIVGKGGYDACIIACFDDTGLMELKAKSLVPVIGIGEAAYLAALLMGDKFSVVTTLSASVPVLQDNLLRYGFANRCAAVRASEVPVLALENDHENSRSLIAEEIRTSILDEKPAAVALGCAGMAELADGLTDEFGLPVIDGVSVAVGLAEMLQQLGLIKRERETRSIRER